MLVICKQQRELESSSRAEREEFITFNIQYNVDSRRELKENMDGIWEKNFSY
jgi:hypothetical protein